MKKYNEKIKEEFAFIKSVVTTEDQIEALKEYQDEKEYHASFMLQDDDNFIDFYISECTKHKKDEDFTNEQYDKLTGFYNTFDSICI